MAVRRVRLRRGTTAENNAYTGVIGEVTVDTEKKTLHVHDGTAGGETLLRSDLSNNASIATDINFTNANRTIGGAMTTNDGNTTVLTLGGADSTVTIAGNLVVTGSTTNNDTLAVASRIIEVAEGAAAAGSNLFDVGIFFTRTDNQNRGLFFFDEGVDEFKLGLDGNTLANTAQQLDPGANYTPGKLQLGEITLKDGLIKNTDGETVITITADTDVSLARDLTVGRNVILNGTSITSQAVGDVLTLFNDNTGGITLGNTGTISLGATGGNTTVGGALQLTDNKIKSGDGTDTITLADDGSLVTIATDLTISGNDLNFADDDVTIGGAVATGGKIITLGSGVATIVKSAGHLRVGSNVIQASDGGSTITLDANDNVSIGNNLTVTGGLVTLANGMTIDSTVNGTLTLTEPVVATSAALKVGGNSIQNSGNSEAIGLTADNSTTTITGTTTILSNNLQINGTSIASEAAADALTLFNNNTGGITLGNTGAITLGAATGSTTVGGALTVNGTGATALDFTNENITIGGTVANVAKTITIGGGAITKTAGVLTIGGNQIKDDSGDTVITFSNDANLTATFAGNIATTTNLTAGTDLTVSGGDITLGASDGGNTTISVPTTDQGGAGHSLTLSSGVGSAGNGSNDGSLILRSGTTAVLTLDTAEKATFAGNIDFSDGTTLGASVVDNQSLTLGGDAGSTVITSGHLRVTSGEILAPDGNSTSITIDNDDNVTVGGNLKLTGNTIQASDGGTTITLDANDNVSIGNNLTVTGGLITLANGMTIDSTANGTLTLTEPVVATSGTLKVGGNTITNSDGENSIEFTADQSTTTITGTTTVLSNNLQINGTSIVSEAVGDALTLFNNNTGGITLGNTGAITLGAVAGSTTVGGALTVNGTGATALDFTDANITIGNTVSTGTNIITIGGGAITETGGVLRVGGNVIQASDGANTISINAGNDLVTFLADIKVGGDTIQSSTAEAIQFTGANVAVKGTLTVENEDLILGTSGGGATTIQVPQSGADSAGHSLTISAGRGNGAGNNGGSLIFQTGGADGAALGTALTLDHANKALFSGNVQISGNLEVDGTTTQIDSTITTYADPMILLNKNDMADTDIGIFMGREATDGNNVAMYWDHELSSFAFASTSADASDTNGVAVNLSGQANYSLEPIKAKALTLDGDSLQVGDSTGTADAFVVAKTGVLTSKNIASFDVDSTDALVVSTAVGADVLVVDTTNSHVETMHIMPLADSTYDLGTDALRFREGFFDTINVGTGVTNAGTNTFSNATPIAITSAGTNGVTFRSDVAENGADGNATLLRVNIGGTDGNGSANFKKFHWVAATDDFSVESGLISEGDFTVGSSKFVVTASTGATTLAGDLDLTKASPTVGASVGNAEILTLGGASSTTKTAGALQVVGNIDFSTDANRTIGNIIGADTTLTIGGSATSITEISGILKISGNKVQSADGGDILVLTDDGDVTVENDLTVTNDLTVSGNTLTFGNSAIIENTGADVLTITEATVVIDGNMTLNGTDLLADNAGESRNIFTNTTGTISLGASTSTVSVGNALNVVGTAVNLSSNNNNVDTEIKIVGRSGGADLAGNDLTISAGASTGTGAGGSLIFQTSITGGGSNAIANATQEVLKLDTANLATFGGNIQINGTSISSEAAGDALTLFSNNTGGVTLGHSGAITLGNNAGSTVVGNTLQINGASIVADNVGEARNIFATTTGLITIGGDGIVAVGGDLKVTGNGIQTGGDNEAITFVDDNSTLTLTASATTTISASNTVTSGDLTVEGRDLILGTATGGATTITVPDQTAENTAGHQITISAGAGKGNGAGGSILFQTAPAGAEDAGAGTLATALTIDSTKTATFAADISVATTSLLSGNVTFGGDLVGSVVGNARNIFTTSTGTITIGASNSTVVAGGNLKLATDIIQNSDGETTITLDSDQGVTITGKANGTSALVITNGDLEISSGGITTDAINGKVQFNDPNLYLGLGNSLNNRDVGIVGAYGDSGNNEFLSGSVYKPSTTVGGKGGEFFLFEGKNKTEANAYTVADSELAGLQVGNVRSVGTQTNGLITTLADSDTLGDHHIVIVTGDNKTVTLPDATSAGMTGRRYIIKDNNAAQDGSADHDTLIVSNGGGIDGSTAVNGIALRTQYAMVEVISNGTQWFIIAESGTVTRL